MKSFAYGSNLCRGWLTLRSPSATYDYLARLPAHELRFDKRSIDGSGKGNARFTGQQEDCVWGVVVDVPDKEKPGLDKAEGLGKGYDEQLIGVIDAAGQTHSVHAYFASSTHIDDSLKPYSWYLDLVVRGASARGLSEVYVNWLRGLESVEDTDPDRPTKAVTICD
jgi:hypothetical protein